MIRSKNNFFSLCTCCTIYICMFLFLDWEMAGGNPWKHRCRAMEKSLQNWNPVILPLLKLFSYNIKVYDLVTLKVSFKSYSNN